MSKNLNFFGNQPILAIEEHHQISGDNTKHENTAFTWPTILHVNVQSLTNKIELLEILTQRRKLDILCLSEHWMSSEQLSLCTIPGYQLVSAFCRKDHIHGGVAIFTHANILGKTKSITTSQFCKEFIFECVAIEIRINNKKFALATIYRSCSFNSLSDFHLFINIFNDFLGLLSDKYEGYIICGDLNVDFLNNSSYKTYLTDLFNSFAITNLLPLEPTRSAAGCQPSALDYVVSNNNNFKAVNINTNIADHLGQLISLTPKSYTPIPKSVATYFYKRFFNENNLLNLKHLLATNDISEVFSMEDVNDAWNYFSNAILYYLELACPNARVKICHNRQPQSWINTDILKDSENLKNLHWLTKNTNSQELSLVYREAKKNFQIKIDLTKKSFYQNKITTSANPSKAIWEVVNSKTGRAKTNNNINCIKLDNTTIITDLREISNLFCHYYSKDIEQKLLNCTGHNSLHSLPNLNENTIFMPNITLDEMTNALKSLKNKRACCGSEDIPVVAMEYIWEYIKYPLCHLFNLFLSSGIYPDKLKLGEIIPLFKKGDKGLIQNYRPITGLPTFSKLFEKIITTRFESFLNKFRLITGAQHGFRRNHSTNTAAFEFIQFIYSSLDKNYFTLALLFDLTRAFDCVDAKILVKKLYALGFRGKTNDLLKSFLSKRKVRVRIGHILSDQNEQQYGVPQGSVLAPLLFLLFINDIEKFLNLGPNTILVLYADDSSIGLSSPSLKELITQANIILDRFKDWCTCNGLLVNENKTNYLCFYKRRVVPDVTLEMSGIKVHRVDSCKFLGLHIDSQLTWLPHIEYILGKINSSYYAIINLKNVLNTKQLLNVYYALTYSHLKYMVLYWGLSVEAERVFILQKRIIRKIFNLGPIVSCRLTFKKEKILTLPSILIMEAAMFVRKNHDKFPTISTIHHYETRYNHEILIPNYRLATCRKSPHCICSYIYNKIPKHMKQLNSNKKFKNTLQQYLVEKMYYSMKEFFDD